MTFFQDMLDEDDDSDDEDADESSDEEEEATPKKVSLSSLFTLLFVL